MLLLNAIPMERKEARICRRAIKSLTKKTWFFSHTVLDIQLSPSSHRLALGRTWMLQAHKSMSYKHLKAVYQIQESTEWFANGDGLPLPKLPAAPLCVFFWSLTLLIHLAYLEITLILPVYGYFSLQDLYLLRPPVGRLSAMVPQTLSRNCETHPEGCPTYQSLWGLMLFPTYSA